jgi:hypothetical protein
LPFTLRLLLSQLYFQIRNFHRFFTDARNACKVQNLHSNDLFAFPAFSYPVLATACRQLFSIIFSPILPALSVSEACHYNYPSPAARSFPRVSAVVLCPLSTIYLHLSITFLHISASAGKAVVFS